MYRYNTNSARTTPPASSRSMNRRSTRAARGSTKRRGKFGGKKDAAAAAAARRIRKSAEGGPAKKWVKVMRPPGPNIRFMAETWVPFSDLTETEREEYERRLLDEQKKRRAEEEESMRQNEHKECGETQQTPHEQEEVEGDTSGDFEVSSANEQTDNNPKEKVDKDGLNDQTETMEVDPANIPDRPVNAEESANERTGDQPLAGSIALETKASIEAEEKGNVGSNPQPGGNE